MKVHILTIARNEAGRYWRSALETWLEFADDVIYLDDDSDDETPAIADEYDDVIQIEPNIETDERMWGTELPYRQALFNFAVDNTDEGDVLFWLDADMAPIADPTPFFDPATTNGPADRDSPVIPPDVEAWAFPLFDFWSLHPTDRAGQRARGRFNYRDEPPFWVAHKNPRVWALKTPSEDPIEFDWGEPGGIHTGHIPQGYFESVDPRVMQVPREVGIGHWGYFNEADRREKFDRYMSVKSQLSEFQLQHAKTIADETPRLTPLHEDVELELVRADE